jgi:hypothetical protein
LQPDTDDIWRISGVSQPNGTVTWILAVNFVIGAGYVNVNSYNTSWTLGVPMGETERFGTGTGMADDHHNLQFKNTDGTWQNWQDVKCVQHVDNLPDANWQWKKQTANSYTIQLSGGVFC